MRNLRKKSKTVSLLLGIFFMASLLAGVGPLSVQKVRGVSLNSRSLQLSNSVPGQLSTYIISFMIPTAGTLGSIKAEFCNNTALFEVACNAPAGLNITAATLSAQSGETGFVIDPSSNANTLILSRTPAATPGGVVVSFTLDNVPNASAAGTSYTRYSTYQTADASGVETDRGSVAYSLNPLFNVTAEVPPFLQFCLGITIAGADCNTAEGDYVNLGNLSTNNSSTGQTQMVVGTNAANGYSILMSGGTLASGNNIIQPLASPTVSAPGISQFGVNLRANSVPAAGQDPSGAGSGAPTTNYNATNVYMYHSGDIVASYGAVEDFRKYTVTYLVNIARSQPPGVYASSFTYTASGNF